MEKKQKKQKSIINSKFKRLLLVGILGWLVYFVSSLVDGVFAGTFLDENALSAVTVVTPFYSVIVFFSYLLVGGASIMYGHEAGAGNMKRAHQIFGLGTVTSFVIGCIVAVILYFGRDAFLGAFNLTPEVLNYAKDYYTWFVPLAVVYPVYIFIYGLVGQDGEERFTLYGDIMEMITNFVVSVLFINVIGIEGLGLSTFLSICATTIVTCLHFFRKTNSIRFAFKFSFKDIWDMIRYGGGGIVATLFLALLDLILNYYIVEHFGDSHLTCYTVLNFTISLAQIFMTVGTAIGPFLSTADGSKNESDIRLCIKIGIKWTIILPVIVSILICSGCWLLPILYNITTPELKALATETAFSIGVFLIFYSFGYFFSKYYAALNKPLLSIISESLNGFVIPLILTYALCPFFGYHGLIIAFAITPVITFLIAILYLKITNKSKRIIDVPEYGNIATFSYDIKITEEDIVKTRDMIEHDLKSIKVEEESIIKTMMVTEDMLCIVKDHNKKVPFARVSISVDNKQIRIMSKDNGEIFNFKSKESLSNYMLFDKLHAKNSLANSIIFSFNSISLKVNRAQ